MAQFHHANLSELSTLDDDEGMRLDNWSGVDPSSMPSPCVGQATSPVRKFRLSRSPLDNLQMEFRRYGQPTAQAKDTVRINYEFFLCKFVHNEGSFGQYVKDGNCFFEE